MLSEKYRPTSLKEVIGQDDKMPEIIGWAKSWENNRPAYKSMLFYGPPGTGKTSTVHAIAHDFNWDVLEINASDSSKPSDIKESIGNAIYTASMRDKILILIDEADSFGKKGFQVLEQLIEDSVNPVILTCNDEYAIRKVTNYFKECSLAIRFSKLKDWKLLTYAKGIVEREGIQSPLLEDLVKNSQGDLRYILNNLNTREVIPRTQEQNIFVIVHDIFAGNWDGDTRGAEIDEIWFCMKQNIDGFYDDILGYTVPEFIEIIDMAFHRLYKLIAHGRSYNAFRQWKYIISLWKMMPRHQKTQRIELKASPFKKTINNDLIIMAKELHMSYKKAASYGNYLEKLIPIWKDAKRKELAKPKTLVNHVAQSTQKSGRNLFDFAVSQSTATVKVGTPDRT